MGIFDFISGIFTPMSSIIDELHTSDEEKLVLRNEMAGIKQQALDKMAEVEKSRLDAMSKVHVAEANSKHWITATWRPMSSIAMVFVIILASFGIIPQPDSNFYDLAQVLLGAYTASRGLEKVAASIAAKK